MAESRALRQQLQAIGAMLELDGCEIRDHAVNDGNTVAALAYSRMGDARSWTVAVREGGGPALDAELAAVIAHVATVGPDFAGWLAGILARAAKRLGGVDALLASRPDSWEADLVRHLAEGTIANQEGEAAAADAPPDGAVAWTDQKLRLARQRTVPDGCELAAVADPGWRIETGKLCARRVKGQRNCRKPSVAELNRRQYRSPTAARRGRWVDSWWPYCLEHFLDYGHWIEDGKVMTWILQEITAGGPGAPGA